ncbi:hypothetical protein MTO96_042256, partial [Rhipicephalus appendiculatus]
MRSVEPGVAPLAVPCGTFLVVESAFVTVCTVLLVAIGILQQRNARDTNDPCSSDGCRRALKELEAAVAPAG